MSLYFIDIHWDFTHFNVKWNPNSQIFTTSKIQTLKLIELSQSAYTHFDENDRSGDLSAWLS